MRKTISMLLIPLLSSILFLGCSNKNIASEDYDIGVVYTSNTKKSSTIQTFNESGEFAGKGKLKVGGINLANFYKKPIKCNDKIYYTMPVLGNKSQDFMIEINQNDLSYKKINNVNKQGITSFSVNERDAYLSISDLTSTNLTKVDLSNTNKTTQAVIEGSCKLTILNGKNLYLFNNIEDSKIRIYEVNIDDLSILNYTDIEDATFITDAVISNNTMYLLINRDGEDELSDRMVALNLESKKFEEIILPFKNLSDIYIQDKYLYVIEQDYLGIEETKNRVAKININTHEIQEFKTSNKHVATDLINNKLYSTDGNKVYIYNTNNLELIRSFNLPEQKNEFVVSIFAK